ncbi:hypothetical protein A2334_04100 [Candidatus Roizmanbacteria bacterium RIFOXYB2_FULL_38_10]|uniref:CAAX prenyl protease 2/Lysostaphin resistance protein A-like domain-containing protein n=1 Tax=Candidatus Roizmanbacteria bacterium RIFOXYD1_FULL_38_12 TaxID=1802093 RepID=A0A1F7KZA9_9BACT|nr:MAG: hypothetical protein A3K47_00210 [Candidatus Roizmanbacteria bacterium RIFOXYA2_FULL_38_14]OGK63224.1 MAG: hypothetical protein A3K27_00210 [Candidatus Roizmanbacteria bacterium RIFOXYA1_FULL_37_12]OGK65070.1 MAG: hypothetical protein A3K38_00210 [Candidatus Roizmanbacteria bacterium RIFOXYB1_FULL_40_23]OGK68624.1 MAG: hypothetical protein A2334_04100 [Candidatus Roizmanbacteria bacterium RIFOXYB2_FULL_38_10]OGK69474.1 MAG: hypothetical protein A3K21_00210 [Candidatus Roizmanbacteria ba
MKEKTSPTQKALNIWAIILILWSIYRAHFKTDLPIWFDEFITKPLFFILPVYWYITKVEGKRFFQGIDLHVKRILPDIIFGIIIGSIFLSIGYLGASSQSKGSLFQQLFTLQFVSMFAVALMTSVSEEILSRGFILKRLYEESKNIFSSITISSILFFFLHIPMLFTSDSLGGDIILKVMVTDLILSIAVSILYLQRKNLLLPIIVHALYSVSLSFFL